MAVMLPIARPTMPWEETLPYLRELCSRAAGHGNGAILPNLLLIVKARLPRNVADTLTSRLLLTSSGLLVLHNEHTCVSNSSPGKNNIRNKTHKNTCDRRTLQSSPSVPNSAHVPPPSPQALIHLPIARHPPTSRASRSTETAAVHRNKGRTKPYRGQ